MPDGETAPRVESSRVRQEIWWLGLGATLFVASILSAFAYLEGLPAVFDEIRFLDKALHFALAGALAFFLDGTLKRRMVGLGVVKLPLAALMLLTPLALEEYLQRFSANRSSSFSDFAADAAGVATMIWLSRRLD